MNGENKKAREAIIFSDAAEWFHFTSLYANDFSSWRHTGVNPTHTNAPLFTAAEASERVMLCDCSSVSQMPDGMFPKSVGRVCSIHSVKEPIERLPIGDISCTPLPRG